jgi:hypothetical protein
MTVFDRKLERNGREWIVCILREKEGVERVLENLDRKRIFDWGVSNLRS